MFHLSCVKRLFPLFRLMSSQVARRDAAGNIRRKPANVWARQKKEEKRSDNLTRTSRELIISDVCTPKSLAGLMGVRSLDVLKLMIRMGENVTSSEQTIPPELSQLIAQEFNFTAVFQNRTDTFDVHRRVLPQDLSVFPPRPPVVTVVGHINHGKTTLLDKLRGTQVALKEAGGITQHIGAFVVQLETGEKITFMDTPGHAAFSSLRERGVKTTDIALLVIAANDGIQEQTIEAIKASLKEKAQLLVVLTKIDTVTIGDEVADTTRIRAGLLQYGVILEEFGGKVPCVEISAQTGRGLQELQQTIVAVAGLMFLRAPIDGDAEGTIIEARKVKGRGIVCTVLVRYGTLSHGDEVIVGTLFGRLKGLTDFQGKTITAATPSIPAEFVGLPAIPPPGEDVFVVKDRLTAQRIAGHRSHFLSNELARRELQRQKLQKSQPEVETGPQLVTAVLKTDVAGSIEGVKKALEELPGKDEINLHIIRSSVGPITESDVNLAILSKSVIISFGVKPLVGVNDLIQKNNVKVYDSRIVYQIVEMMFELLSSKVAPRTIVEVLGSAKILQIFQITKKKNEKFGVAGCQVTEGVMKKGALLRLLRGGEIIYEGKLATLKSYKQNVNEVRKGNECGISLAEFGEFEKGDILHSVSIRQIPRRLGDPK